jgi:creatinine amidohydrolase
VASPYPPPLAQLCIADEATFWPWRKWSDFAAMDGKAKALVVVPITGMADAALGHPLDAEELVLTSVLKAASELRPAGVQLLVLPPLRFVLGPIEACAFPVTPPVAHSMIREVAESVVAAGFRRIVLFNSSPWNEDLVDAAARDLRISLGIQTFCVNLGALGLDFHATRNPNRWMLQTLLTGLYGKEPRESPKAMAADGFVRAPLPPVPQHWEHLAAAEAAAPGIVSNCATRLASLLQEIHRHPELMAHP